MDESAESTAELPIPAPRAKRFLNLLVDLFCFYVFLTGILMAIEVGAPHFLERWKNERGLAIATNLVIFFLYYVGSEALTLRSPGKFVTRTRVVDFEGGVPSFTQIAFRTILRQFPLEWLPFFASDDEGRVGLPLHDRWSRTVVVEIPRRD